MADEFDRASEIEQQHREAAIRNTRNKLSNEIGPEECAECGNAMPEIRRKYGFSLCVECQTFHEKQLRLFQ